MIELLRYARVKAQGLVSAFKLDLDTVKIEFKRFDVETGKEVSPETSLVNFGDLAKRKIELMTELEVVNELLTLKPGEK